MLTRSVSQGLLLALAALCATSEPNRRAVLDAQLLPPILDSFTHPFVGVRAAACHCIRALSRSVSVLRTDMVESEAQVLLVWLLREDENEVVKVTATAAVANLLLEFSPLRTVRQHGVPLAARYADAGFRRLSSKLAAFSVCASSLLSLRTKRSVLTRCGQSRTVGLQPWRSCQNRATLIHLISFQQPTKARQTSSVSYCRI